MDETDYSGKLVLRMPKSLHRHAAFAANRDGVSLNQFIVSSVAEQVGAYRFSVFNSNRLAVTFSIRVETGGGQTLTQGFDKILPFRPDAITELRA
jgi:hypothetical protein